MWIGDRDGGHGLNPRGWRRELGPERKFRLEEIVIYQAGRAALDYLNGKQGYDNDWEKSVDHRESWKRALWLTGGDEHAATLLIESARHRAFVILDAHKPELQRLANALETDRFLSGDRVAAILNGFADREWSIRSESS